MTGKELLINKICLYIGTTSWAGYELFKDVSQTCGMILPITGVCSFLLLSLINIPKIFDTLDFIKKRFTKK